MAVCLAVGDAVLRIAAAAFTLTWPEPRTALRHEQVWEAGNRMLLLTEEQISGDVFSNAPNSLAVWDRGWWRWTPGQEPVAQLVLRHETMRMPQLCVTRGHCQSIASLLPDADGEVTLKACP